MTSSSATAMRPIDWSAVRADLDEIGAAPTGALIDARAGRELAALFDDDTRFRATIDMARHRFGQGTYRYFAAPLPPLVAELRHRLWPPLLDVAREWAERRGRPAPWPDDLDDWLERCHAAGQSRSTPLLLRYGPGDWNALHRDLYGDLVFPLQVAIGLDRPGDDYEGGEFVVVEQRPRAQSRVTAFTVPQGDGVVFATSDRPTRTARGWANAPLRHGVSVVRRGRRTTLGLIFHDAR